MHFWVPLPPTFSYGCKAIVLSDSSPEGTYTSNLPHIIIDEIKFLIGCWNDSPNFLLAVS